MENKLYSQILDLVKEDKYYLLLQDKIDQFGDNKRIITTHTLSMCAVKFAIEMNFNKYLVELIALARDLAYPAFGRLGTLFIKDKYPEYSQAECSIIILENILTPYQIYLNEEIKKGIISSLSNEAYSLEGRLVKMLDYVFELGQTSQTDYTLKDENNKYLFLLEKAWNKVMNKEINNKNIAENFSILNESKIFNIK